MVILPAELRQTLLHLYAETKIPSFIFPPPNCPQKPTRIYSKIKALLMHKGLKKRETEENTQRRTQTWQTPVLVSVWGIGQPSQGKSLTGLWAILQLYLW